MPYPVENLVKHALPSWAKNAAIYQVNTRQFSQQGSFDKVTEQLTRIKTLGCDIVWLMPIHPIGVKNRKGSLGSPYAVQDFYGVNSEFGDANSLKALVARAHSLDMKVIIDWVPNHSAWDNPLTESHPDWYAKDYKGDFRPSPWWDWDDIIEFDYSVPELREYMIDALCYWVKEFDIDGYRCDVAGYVPNDFWKQARDALDAIKPVFMLAEWENRDMHEHAFHASYAWSWNETMFGIAQQQLNLDKLRKYYSFNQRAWPKEALRMTFVSNHDENAWEGTPDEKFAEALPTAVVLSVLGSGFPLVHNGQEAGESKRLQFFERDPIEWSAHSMNEFYTHLLSLRKQFSALFNGEYGAQMNQVPNTAMQEVFSFVREDAQSKWFMVFNFSNRTVSAKFKEALFVDEYTHLLKFKASQSEEDGYAIAQDYCADLDAWEYQVYYKTKR